MKLEIHTLAWGNAEWLRECQPTLEKWRKRHGYPLTVWDDSHGRNYPEVKFCERDMLLKFLEGDSTHMLYVDADVHVHPEAPAFPEIRGLAMASDALHRVCNDQWQEWCREHFGFTPQGFDYSNAGVWSIDRESAEKFLEYFKPPFIEGFQDQHQFNAAAYLASADGMTFVRLPWLWNSYAGDFEPAWFQHLWGPDKEKNLEALKRTGTLDAVPDGKRYSFRPEQWPPSDKMIVTQFVKDCGLGNQMFEFAAGLALSKRTGLPLRLNWKPSPKREFGLGHFGIGALPFTEYPVVSCKLGQGNRKILEASEKAILSSGHRFCAVAHPFQAEECFAEVAGQIRELYKLEPLPLDVPEGVVPVAVQVRRGDYVKHPRLDVVTEGYFLNAMDWMRAKLGKVRFYVVSDDPEWCRRMFGKREDVTVMPPQEAIDGLRTMVACKAHIISNSTFGWWGAWLGESGPVVVPEIWHHKPGSYGNWKPAPDRWVRISLKRGEVQRIEPEVVRQSSLQTFEVKYDKAIVYPYHLNNDKWHALRYSLRSVEKHFTDRKCPVVILGTRRPHWLANHPRVRFIECWGYEAALLQGCQLAGKVLWMNDDILFLKDTGWADVETPLHFGPVSPELRMDLVARRNSWRDGYLKMLDLLAAEGVVEPVNYSTHTPYLYRREQVVEVFEKFGVWSKMPLEMAVFNLFPAAGEHCNGHRVQAAPFGEARYLNHTDRILNPDLKAAIAARFPDFAPWEIPITFEV